MANRNEIIKQVQNIVDTKGVETALNAMIDALDIMTSSYEDIDIEKTFFENLAMELIKEKQRGIRDAKGVVYMNGGMFTSEAPDTDVEPFDCTGCVCESCEKSSCKGCRFEDERCEECGELED